MIIEAILNRLRGTGVIKSFGKIKLFNKEIELKFVGNHLYGLYLALVFGLISTNVYVGLSVLVAYLLGESAGWGKWLGWLVTDVDKRNIQLVEEHQKDNEGKGYPWIHYISSLFLSEKDESFIDLERISRQTSFSTLALTIRGIYWWLPVYLVLACFSIISFTEAIIICILLGISFPIAAFIGLNWDFKFKFKMFELSRGWENQEFIYGLFQGSAILYIIFKLFLI